ncbi:MAG: hypothetical protein LRY39_00330 [Alphaproteobacteria bacterium]|nr:hypothetical protein [Alphaproteobacteria bacterium]
MTYINKKNMASGLTAAFMVMATAVPGNADGWMPSQDSPNAYLQYQHDLLKPNEDFIKKMPSCCTLRDGRGNLEEVINDGTDPRFPADPDRPQAQFPYIVIITHDLNGQELSEPAVVYIPKSKVLSTSQANAACKSDRILNPESTCKPPTFNVLWAYDNSNSNAPTGERSAPFHITNIWCYYPYQGMQ